jgi:hypothetical protein
MTDSNRDLGPGVSHLEIAVMGQQEGLGDGFALGEQARLAEPAQMGRGRSSPMAKRQRVRPLAASRTNPASVVLKRSMVAFSSPKSGMSAMRSWPA